jgi:hypothetical protein
MKWQDVIRAKFIVKALVYRFTVNTTIQRTQWSYSDMFRLTLGIVRISLEPVNFYQVYFWDPKRTLDKISLVLSLS